MIYNKVTVKQKNNPIDHALPALPAQWNHVWVVIPSG